MLPKDLKLRDYLSISEAQRLCFKALIETIEDLGGDEEALRRFLEPDYNRELISKIAKLLIGPIWEMADTDRTMYVDFTSSKREFFSQNNFVNIEILEGIRNRIWSETKPGSFAYSLLYLPSKIYKLSDVTDYLDQYTDNLYEHAGLRELITYTATIKNLCGYTILAAGSSNGTTIPQARSCKNNGCISIHPMDMGDPDLRQYNSNHFWLVRKPVELHSN